MKILVKKDTVYDGRGRSTLVKARWVVQTVACRYSDGRVRTSSGDVWRAKPHNQRGVELIAVA